MTLKTLVFVTLGALSLTSLGRAEAASWGVGVGHNNPLGSKIGLDLAYIARPLVFELGISGLGASGGDSASGRFSGDVDVKAVLGGGGDFHPYVEGGLLFGAGAAAGDSTGVGIGLNNPFVGVGLFVEGSVVYAFGGADMLLSTKKIFGVLSAGIKL